MRPLLFFTLCVVGLTALGQDNTMSFGYARTELEKSAVNLAIDYAKNLTEKLSVFHGNQNSLISFTPDIKVLVGSNDAFNGITAKYVGNFMVFDTVSVGGIITPNTGKIFHNFPVAVGLESDQSFSFINTLAEVGYVPWYQNSRRAGKLLRATKVGFFLQGGYKSSIDSMKNTEGGAADESKEQTDSGLLRAKLAVGFSPTLYFDDSRSYGIALIGNGQTWYDFLNSAWYYRLEGKFRIIVLKSYYLDFGYEKGSGAPNFNQGEQFTTNLTVRF